MNMNIKAEHVFESHLQNEILVPFSNYFSNISDDHLEGHYFSQVPLIFSLLSPCKKA